MVSKTIKRSVTGYVLGMAIGVIITIITGYAETGTVMYFSPELIDTMGSELGALTAQVLLSGLFGAICFATMGFHEVERLGLIGSCALHYGCIMGSFFPIALFLHWFDFDPVSIGIMVGVMTVAYFIIWFIMYLKYKAEVRELNEMLGGNYDF